MGKRAEDKGQTTLQATDWTAQALHERVKELSCLYRISRVSARSFVAPDKVLQCIVELIPPAWQHPEIAAARIVLDGRRYETSGFKEGHRRQAAEVVVEGKCRGVVEVVYTEDRPCPEDGPFLKNERSLLNAIARQIAVVVEHQQAEEERAHLQKQLMHADRLATIGQLAAGVAHELNEPLSSILGFAQLLQRNAALPDGGREDVEKIVTASLHAREIIKKLLLFARQTPPFRGPVNLNQVIVGAIDLKMPKLSGIDLIRHIRENHKNIAVMMITGYATVESAVEAVKSGAEEYVSKPFTDAELFAAVRRVLDKLKRRREGPVTNREYAEFLPQTGYKPVNGESLPEHWYADDGPQLCGFAAKFLVMRPCLRSHLSHGPSEGDEAVGPVFFRLSDTKLPAHCQWQ